jgi:hypothetical protein
MINAEQLSLEAEIFGAYFLKKKPTAFVIDLYKEANEKLKIVLDKKEERILKFILRNRWSVGMIDSGLVFINPKSEVRHKMFIMLAILECQPDYTNLFFTKNQPKTYFFYILWVGIRAFLKAALGVILVKLV